MFAYIIYCYELTKQDAYKYSLFLIACKCRLFTSRWHKDYVGHVFVPHGNLL